MSSAESTTGLSSSFNSIEEFADVTLVCADGRSFKAHKLVLSMWSPYFREIFLNNSCDHPVIILRDMKSEDIQVILHFIYEGQALLHPENETRILETAVSLQIAGFSQMKEPKPTQNISSSTPTPTGTGSSQYLNVNNISSSAVQQRHTVIGISPIPVPTTMEETYSAKNIITPSETKIVSSKTTPVYKPHKRQKLELTPTKIGTVSPSKITKAVEEKDEKNMTTMYSLDQQRIIITEQEIPRCSTSPSQQVEYIEIINISSEQNSVTLNLATELDAAPPLEPAETEASFVFSSNSPTYTYSLPHASASQGTSTNHRTIIADQDQSDTIVAEKDKVLNNKRSKEEFVPCPKCGKHVKETSLRVHISRTHLEEGTILVCPVCSKVIHSKGVYYKHMFLHRKKGQKSATTQPQ